MLQLDWSDEYYKRYDSIEILYHGMLENPHRGATHNTSTSTKQSSQELQGPVYGKVTTKTKNPILPARYPPNTAHASSTCASARAWDQSPGHEGLARRKNGMYHQFDQSSNVLLGVVD
jgi:hypothetical protein